MKLAPQSECIGSKSVCRKKTGQVRVSLAHREFHTTSVPWVGSNILKILLQVKRLLNPNAAWPKIVAVP